MDHHHHHHLCHHHRHLSTVPHHAAAMEGAIPVFYIQFASNLHSYHFLFSFNQPSFVELLLVRPDPLQVK